MLRQQPPNAHLVAGDFIRQQLTHLSLQTGRVGGRGSRLGTSSPHLHILGRRVGVKGVEFFLQAVIGDNALDAALTSVLVSAMRWPLGQHLPT
jgi:hypothetical protein